MRLRLLIDIIVDPSDVPWYAERIADQAIVGVKFDGRSYLTGNGTPSDRELVGRFVGAKEAYDSVAEVEVQKKPQ